MNEGIWQAHKEKLEKFFSLCYIISKERQPPTRWVACLVEIRKSAQQTWQSLGAVFLCANYFLFWETNVSNASINNPKTIRSWKVKYTIDITSIPKEFRQRHPATRLSGIFYHINKLLATLCNLRYKYTKKEKLEKNFSLCYIISKERQLPTRGVAFSSFCGLKATPRPASFGVVFLIFYERSRKGRFLDTFCRPG